MRETRGGKLRETSSFADFHVLPYSVLICRLTEELSAVVGNIRQSGISSSDSWDEPTKW
jgi:hypothetical protein